MGPQLMSACFSDQICCQSVDSLLIFCLLGDYHQIKYVIIGSIKYDVNTIIKLFIDNLPVYGLIFFEKKK